MMAVRSLPHYIKKVKIKITLFYSEYSKYLFLYNQDRSN